MAYGTVLKIGGVDIIDPKEYQWNLYDLSSEDCGRSESGLTTKDRIAQKRKIELKWPPMSLSDMSTLLTALNASVFLSVQYIDAMTGTWRTMTAYVGDRSAPLYNMALGLWSEMSANLIEK